MKYALVYKERICQLVDSEKECFPVASELVWQEVPDFTTTDYIYQQGEVKPKPVIKGIGEK